MPASRARGEQGREWDFGSCPTSAGGRRSESELSAAPAQGAELDLEAPSDGSRGKEEDPECLREVLGAEERGV